jgi:nicotinate-nucleotide--dimethylbenzimidazole phosphoribosyltransferase
VIFMPFLPAPIAPLTHTEADKQFALKLRHKIDHKTKPMGALGALEDLALQLALIQKNDVVGFTAPQMLVFAADHGIAEEGVSAFPQAVTQQMVSNMLAGGAAVNVFARQHGFALTVVDAGVAAELPAHPQLLRRKMALGTRNSMWTTAMAPAQAVAAVEAGAQVVAALPGNVLALGEMGIANTSSAALIFALLCGVPMADAAGRGTGLTDAQLDAKIKKLEKARTRHAACTEPMDVLAAVGGFEIAMMVGAMLQAATLRRVVLVDGFIASAAALLATRIASHAKDYMVFCHVGSEHGHRLMLHDMGVTPLLDIGLRLGEGTGALLAWPLVQSAGKFLNEMASFESAGVSGKS